MNMLRLYPGLFKIPLSLMISFSAIFGFIMFETRPDISLFLTGAGVFLLACGGACLNNFQDRHIDRLFSRTRHRALASKALPPNRALSLSGILIIVSITMLYFIHNDLTLPLLGAAAILMYNGIYTPLKPRTIFAIIPGTLCGMLPPLIGWNAAGGDLFSLKIASIMIIFGLWQLPHFWLILLNHRSEYCQSGIPNMLQRLNRFQLGKIVFIWIVNLAVMLLFIPILFWGNKNLTSWIFVVAALVIVSVAFFNTFLLRFQNNYHLSFKFLNGTIFFIMLVVIVERLI